MCSRTMQHYAGLIAAVKDADGNIIGLLQFPL